MQTYSLESLQRLYDEEGWRVISEIANQYGVERPEGGWDESFQLIVDAQASAMQAAEKEEPARSKKKRKAKEKEPKEAVSKYPTDFYKGAGIPYCEQCGAAYQNRINGDPVCPEGRSDCKRVNGGD